MILLIDVGNTRTKWALAGDADAVLDSQTGALSHFGVCMNAELSLSSLQITAQKASKVVVANVAGEQMAQQLQQLLLPLSIHFIKHQHNRPYRCVNTTCFNRILCIIGKAYILTNI